jgi:hypothetical protein
VSRPRPCLRWLLLALALVPGRHAVAAPIDPRLARLREEAVALAARDDAASLGRALDLLGEAARAEPRFYQARADRTLIEFLQAAARRDEATRLQSGDELMRSGRELRERGLEELRPLVREHAADPAVARALAVYYGLDGNGEQAAELVGRARASGGADPWLDFAELAARARTAGPGAAVPMLQDFADAHPGLLRARMMLARAQLDLSRIEDSLATVDALLAENPEHDSAKRLKAAILSPPPARLIVLPAPVDAPPPQRPGYLPRKPLQRSADGSR